jgi:hypothetical protein
MLLLKPEELFEVISELEKTFKNSWQNKNFLI